MLFALVFSIQSAIIKTVKGTASGAGPFLNVMISVAGRGDRFG